MKVFKFGGASVKDAASVKNVAKVIGLFPREKLVVVVSAMGKTTNALEQLAESHMAGKQRKVATQLEQLHRFHRTIMDGLFKGGDPVYNDVESLIDELTGFLKRNRSKDYDYVYDQVVSAGELLSTRIVSAYLNAVDIHCHWQDIREILHTDNTFREAKVNWEQSGVAIRNAVKKVFAGKQGQQLILTQGFIGKTGKGKTTTLGREGSDYTAAILAHALDAEEVTIWKDVPGVLNADPKWFDETALLPQLSYRDAIELAYYGATVIHPKTIKPLENKKIPLRVRSFLKPGKKGTIITKARYKKLMPSFIFRINQCFVSISPRDFSFIVEENLSVIFGIFARHRVKMNVMQNTAISFSVSVDNDRKVPGLLKDLRKHFAVEYQSGKLELITIRYYDQKTIDRVCVQKELLLEQKGPTTVQLVVKDLG